MGDDMKWISVNERLPEIGDYSVLGFFRPGGVDMIHVQEYFKDITAGISESGEQLYTKWYLPQGVTHWMPLPDAPTRDSDNA